MGIGQNQCPSFLEMDWRRFDVLDCKIRTVWTNCSNRLRFLALLRALQILNDIYCLPAFSVDVAQSACEIKSNFILVLDLNDMGVTNSIPSMLFSLASARIRGFSEKKRLNARGFAREFLRSGMLYRPGKSLKRRGKSSSLHSKKIFCLGRAGFLCVTS